MGGHPCPDSRCCSFIDVVTWSGRYRLKEVRIIQQWIGQFDDLYLQEFGDDPYGPDDALVYFGQHVQRNAGCGILYYLANNVRNTFDAFERNIDTGATIVQDEALGFERSVKWSAPLGLLSGEGLDVTVNPCGTWVGNSITSWRSNSGRFCVAGPRYGSFDPGDGRVIQIRSDDNGAILSEGRFHTPLDPEARQDPWAVTMMPTSDTQGIYIGNVEEDFDEHGVFTISAGEVFYAPDNGSHGVAKLGNHLLSHFGVIYYSTGIDFPPIQNAVWSDSNAPVATDASTSLSFRYGKIYAVRFNWGSSGHIASWQVFRDVFGAMQQFDGTGSYQSCLERDMRFVTVVKDNYPGGDPPDAITDDDLAARCGDDGGDVPKECDCQDLMNRECLTADLVAIFRDILGAACTEWFASHIDPGSCDDGSAALCVTVHASACLSCCLESDRISSLDITIESGPGIIVNSYFLDHEPGEILFSDGCGGFGPIDPSISPEIERAYIVCVTFTNPPGLGSFSGSILVTLTVTTANGCTLEIERELGLFRESP